jgi:multiple antibiotic resistance protein
LPHAELLTFFASSLTSLFVAVDPLAAVPVFLVMTAADGPEARRKAAKRASVVTLATLALFAWAGPGVLAHLGISPGSFQIAGGLLLFLAAVDMLRVRPSRTRISPEEEAEGVHKADVSVFPLAIPLLAGPGATSTVMMLATRVASVPQAIVLSVTLVLTALSAYLLLRSASFVGRRLGHTGMNVIERVLGLLLAAMAVQFVLDGLLRVGVLHAGTGAAA